MRAALPRLMLASLVLAALLTPPPAAAWTPTTQLTIAREAAHLAPPDLERLIEKHQKRFLAGVQAPFADADPQRHQCNPDGSGLLDQVIAAEVATTIEMIRDHRPFADIVWRLGVVAHYAAEANNPLAASAADATEARYRADYARYVESALPRFPLVFYGEPADHLAAGGDRAIVRRALARSRGLYPLLSSEYRRIGYASGRLSFDDRSTAFGASSVTFSRAVNDVMLLMRHIWLRAGGGDPRGLPRVGDRLLKLPRITPSR
jgi:hypothetical protein